MTETRKDEIDRSAETFARHYPQVWSYFVRFTHEIIDRGFTNYSVNAVFERIRWETDFADSEGKSTFRLNNNYRAWYARRFMKEYPQYAGFFRTRSRKSASQQAVKLPELGPEDFAEENV